MAETEAPVAEARKLIEQDQQERTKAAAQAIQAVLAQHQCELSAVPQITADGRIVAAIQVVTK
jgi:hypothetical protein